MTVEKNITRRDFHALATLFATDFVLGYSSISEHDSSFGVQIQEAADEFSRDYLRTVPASNLTSTNVDILVEHGSAFDWSVGEEARKVQILDPKKHTKID